MSASLAGWAHEQYGLLRHLDDFLVDHEDDWSLYILKVAKQRIEVSGSRPL